MEGESDRCPDHGLALNPQGECVLCKRATKQPPKPAMPKWVAMFLGIGGLSVLGWVLLQGAGPAEDQLGKTVPTAVEVRAVARPPVIEASMDDFIGTWTSRTCAGTFYTTFHADGTYTGHLVRNNTDEEVPIPDGSWEVRDGRLVWIHAFDTSRTEQGEEDINKIVKLSENSFTVRETNGALTTFQMVE